MKEGTAPSQRVAANPLDGYRRNRAWLVLTLILLVSIAATVFTAGVVFGQHRQVVTGELVTPAGPAQIGQAVIGSCGFVGATTEWAARKHVGVRFAVDPETWLRPFKLESRTPADLDITFVRGSQRWTFDKRGLGQEDGGVPDGATHAYICLVAGGPTAFVYVGG